MEERWMLAKGCWQGQNPWGGSSSSSAQPTSGDQQGWSQGPNWGPILPLGCGTHSWGLHALCGHNLQVCVWLPCGGCVLVHSRHWLDHWPFLHHLWTTGQWCHQCFGEKGAGAHGCLVYLGDGQGVPRWLPPKAGWSRGRGTYTMTCFLEKKEFWGGLCFWTKIGLLACLVREEDMGFLERAKYWAWGNGRGVEGLLGRTRNDQPSLGTVWGDPYIPGCEPPVEHCRQVQGDQVLHCTYSYPPAHEVWRWSCHQVRPLPSCCPMGVPQSCVLSFVHNLSYSIIPTL